MKYLIAIYSGIIYLTCSHVVILIRFRNGVMSLIWSNSILQSMIIPF